MYSNPTPKPDQSLPYTSQCLQKIDELHNLKNLYGDLKNSYVYSSIILKKLKFFLFFLIKSVKKHSFKLTKGKSIHKSKSKNTYNQPVYSFNTSKLDQTLKRFSEVFDFLTIFDYIYQKTLKKTEDDMESELKTEFSPLISTLNPSFVKIYLKSVIF